MVVTLGFVVGFHQRAEVQILLQHTDHYRFLQVAFLLVFLAGIDGSVVVFSKFRIVVQDIFFRRLVALGTEKAGQMVFFTGLDELFS